MPAGPGDSHLITLFADVHYYFAPPTSKPQHHRLSRGSYLYLFQNANERRAKIEVANHAGTPDQDAFSGYFDHVSQLTYSYKQPTLFTFTIDGSNVQGHEQWHIPSYNERNEQKYLYKINALDVYLWTEKDASTFLGHLKNVLPIAKLEMKDAPAKPKSPAEHRDSMSPVVQQLEQTAIAAQFPPRAESTTSANSFPGPPTPATTVGTATSPQLAQPAPVAIAYNPAAPAAPEPIAHREKTPPPPDAGAGTGLTNAAQYDAVPQNQYANVPNTFQSSGQPNQQYAYFTGPGQQQQIRHPSVTNFAGPPTQGTPPLNTGSSNGSLPPPPPPPGARGPSPQQYNPSFAPPPGQGQPQPSSPPPNQASLNRQSIMFGQTQPTSPPPNQASFNRQSSYGGPPGQTQFANYPQQAPSFGPSAIASPGLPATPGYAPSQQQPPTPSAPPSYSAGLPPPPPSQYQPSQQQQVFGYSNYSYSQQGGGAQGYNPANPNAGYTGDVHAQAYRPTEGETMAHGKPPPPKRENTSETRQRLEGKVTQVEAGVGKFMKRLDKLW